MGKKNQRKYDKEFKKNAVNLYVAVVLDLFSRKIVGLAMHERMTTDLVLAALTQAFLHRCPQSGLIHHSSWC